MLKVINGDEWGNPAVTDAITSLDSSNTKVMFTIPEWEYPGRITNRYYDDAPTKCKLVVLELRYLKRAAVKR